MITGQFRGVNLEPANPTGFAFNSTIGPQGYGWWYADGVSDDGRHAVTVIAFIGSVFSPAYAAARRRGLADPLNHCAINVALYGDKVRRWCFTEYGQGSVQRTSQTFVLGHNQVRRTADSLVFDIDDRTPLGRALRGRISLKLRPGLDQPVALDTEQKHLWWPVSPHASIEVALDKPGLAFRGRGYHDANMGHEPLEQAFRRWSWSRTYTGDNTIVAYDCQLRGEARVRPRTWRFSNSGAQTLTATQPGMAFGDLPRTRWWLRPNVRTPGPVEIARTLEDTPFYMRYLLQPTHGGPAAESVCEYLDLDRFRNRWVQRMLWFRMRRARKVRAALPAEDPCKAV